MKKKSMALLLFVLIGSFSVVQSQNQPVKKAKPYDSWVKTPGQSYTGILFNVQDSTIQLTNLYANSFSSFHFQDINKVQLRRKNSVLRGAIIGGTIGLIPAIALASEVRGDMDVLYAPLILIAGLGGMAVGTGIGAGIGSIRITIPIERRRENFDHYRSKLSYFALNKNSYKTNDKMLSSSQTQSNQTNTIEATKSLENFVEYEHESFVGIVMGPSFLMGDLTKQFIFNGKNYQAVNGSGGNWINVGYRLKGNMGITFAGFQNDYETKGGNINEWWMMNGFLIGPMWIYPIGKKVMFDLKPRVGYAGSALNLSETLQLSGNGFVINPCASIRYNFARRWCAFTETGYTYSNQKLQEVGKVGFSSFNLGFGIGYRYK
jgi:hypothetical protein